MFRDPAMRNYAIVILLTAAVMAGLLAYFARV